MAIGSAIVLFVLGAILAYGVEAEIAGLDIDTIGYILMGAGLVGGLIGLLYALVGAGAGAQKGAAYKYSGKSA